MQPTDFARFMLDIDDGQFNQRATDRLRELVEAVEETGKGGKIVMTFSVTKDGKHTASVETTVKVTKPERGNPATMFFVRDGSLMREDPRQLELKTIPSQPTVLRTLDGGKSDD